MDDVSGDAARREDLRATASAIEADAERIAGLEREKLSRDPADPAVGDLSRELSRLGRRVRATTAAETELQAEIAGESKPPAGDAEPAVDAPKPADQAQDAGTTGPEGGTK